jgi:RNA polymerase sigma factor (sigma-70 family)
MADLGELIRRWRAGDEQAAAAIYNQHRSSMFRLAYALLNDPADAEEVTQDALVYALIHIDRYDPHKAQFTTWLHTITVSRCRNRRRRRLLPSLSLLTWLKRGGDSADPTPDPEAQALRAAARDEVWEAVQSLSQPLREAILLRHWAGHTYQDMAEILGCSLRTAQSRVRLAHERLATMLKSEDSLYVEDGRAS